MLINIKLLTKTFIVKKQKERCLKKEMIFVCSQSNDWQDAVERLGDRFSAEHKSLILKVIEDFFFLKKIQY